jgi:hypothetical protein
MANGTNINVTTNTVEIRNVHNRIDIVAPNTGTTIAVTQPTTRVVQVNVPGPQGVQGASGNESDVSGLNAFTGSIQTQVNTLTAATSSYVLTSVTASMLQPYVLNVSTSSFVTNAQTSSMTVLSSSFASTASYISPTFISASAAASGFGSVPAETDPIFVARSASLATTGSNTFNGNQYIIGSVTASLFKGDTEGTASWARNALTASSVGQLNQNVTILGNLQVFGTASYTYVSASQLDVGTNFISVNVAEPAQRFGGLKVYDSGSLSHQATASLAWDSTNNHWVYQNASGSTYSGGMFLSGPRNTGSLGDEPELTRWRVARSDGGDHLNDTQIFSSASVHQITGSLLLSGSGLIVSSSVLQMPQYINITGSTRQLLSGSSPSVDWENRTLHTSTDVTSVNWNTLQLINPLYGLAVDWNYYFLNDTNINTSIDWGGRSLYTLNGVGALIWNDDYVNSSNTYLYRLYNQDTQDNFALSIQYSGETIYAASTSSAGIDPAQYQLVSLSGSYWLPTNQTTDTSTKMLGIVIVTGDDPNKGQVLIEGDITWDGQDGVGIHPGITSDDKGTPVYIRAGAASGGMSIKPPATGYVRIVGYVYFVNSSRYIFRFKPSNDWYKLS